MLVRTLVSGVRSSCEASATSWRCARVDSSSAASIVLKLAASRLSSSSPLTSIRCERSCVSVTCSAVSVSVVTGASAARATTRPRPAAIDDAAGSDQEQEEPDLLERLVRLGERPCDLHRCPRSVCEREDSEVDAVDVERRSRMLALSSLATASTSSETGNSMSCRSGDEHASVGLDELDVAASLPNSGRTARNDSPPRSREDAEWLPRDLRGPLLERFVDRCPQLLARHDVDEHRCKDDAQRYGYGRGYRDAGDLSGSPTRSTEVGCFSLLAEGVPHTTHGVDQARRSPSSVLRRR